MTPSYVAFGPDMLHSPLPFGIQARWQGSVGCAQDVPTILVSFDTLLSAADAAHHLVAHRVGNSLDQLTGTSAGGQYSYDGRGNLTQVQVGSSVTTYRYDAADRLSGVTLPTGTTISYAYDAEGRRVQQTSGSGVTNYLWDEASLYGDVVQETDGSGATQASYVLGKDQVLAETRSGATSYYLDDGQGSVRLLTNSAGAVTDSYTYDAFGNLLTSQGTTVNPYRYTGQLYDSLTGLYYLRSRSYDPTTGRFTSADTTNVTLNNPTELNRYLYASSNLVNISDPTGHEDDIEYPLTIQAVQGNAEPAEEEAGVEEQLLGGIAQAHLLSVQAILLEMAAQQLYMLWARGNEFQERAQGETGVGLEEFVTIGGAIRRVAALNDVGLGKDFAQYAPSYALYYLALRLVTMWAGYSIIAESGNITNGKPGDAVHEERYLYQYALQNFALIPDKSDVFAGVPQNTICHSCANAFKQPIKRYNSLILPLPGEDKWFILAGWKAPEDLPGDPFLPGGF